MMVKVSRIFTKETSHNFGCSNCGADATVQHEGLRTVHVLPADGVSEEKCF